MFLLCAALMGPIQVFVDIQFSKIRGLLLVRSFGLHYFPDSGISDENAVSATSGSRLLSVLVRNLRIDVTGPRQRGN